MATRHSTGPHDAQIKYRRAADFFEKLRSSRCALMGYSGPELAECQGIEDLNLSSRLHIGQQQPFDVVWGRALGLICAAL